MSQGYNDVTPKLGASRLVATTRGKPILTTWGFGLGRAVSFTTDNGAGNTMWASQVWADENDQYSGSFPNINSMVFVPFMNVPIVGSVPQAVHGFSHLTNLWNLWIKYQRTIHRLRRFTQIFLYLSIYI